MDAALQVQESLIAKRSLIGAKLFAGSQLRIERCFDLLLLFFGPDPASIKARGGNPRGFQWMQDLHLLALLLCVLFCPDISCSLPVL